MSKAADPVAEMARRVEVLFEELEACAYDATKRERIQKFALKVAEETRREDARAVCKGCRDEDTKRGSQHYAEDQDGNRYYYLCTAVAIHELSRRKPL